MRDDEGHERRACPDCGRVHYAHSKLAVGAIVRRGGKVLLAKRARDPHQGEWDLPGGFLEAGEHPEDGLARELKEEAGVAVTSVALVAIATADYAGEPTLNLVYDVIVAGEPRARDDVAAFAWFGLDALPPMAFPHEQAAVNKARGGRDAG